MILDDNVTINLRASSSPTNNDGDILLRKTDMPNNSHQYILEKDIKLLEDEKYLTLEVESFSANPFSLNLSEIITIKEGADV